MRISERFNLNKVQPQLDFVDVDTNTDTPLFLDPFFLSLRTDNWSVEASKTIRSFFQQVSTKSVYIECKNYSSDPANPELDQLAGRFSPNRGKVGLLICRSIGEMDRFIARCQDTYRDERGLIVPIIDEDIIRLLSSFVNPDSDYMEKFLSDRIRTIATN